MNPSTTLPGHSQAATSTTAQPVHSKAPRFDMYCAIHKALRQFMAHTLRGLGALDASEDDQRHVVLGDVDSLLAMLRSHLQHENDFLHTAIEARQPGGARQTADEHLEHQEAIHNLEDEARALRDAPPEHRAQLALRLYRHLAAFVGENLVHMQVEETRNNATLWALYSDEELLALHDRLVASIAPAEMALVARWMAAALSVPELVAMFSDMRGKAPPPAFEALLGVARTQLDERRWAQLARGLGLPPVPGLMTA
jgi:hypothetical protein